MLVEGHLTALLIEISFGESLVYFSHGVARKHRAACIRAARTYMKCDRNLVRRKLAFTQCSKSLLSRRLLFSPHNLVAGRDGNTCNHNLAKHVIVKAHHRHLCDDAILKNHALYLSGIDVLPTHEDHVLCTSDNCDSAIRRLFSKIARQKKWVFLVVIANGEKSVFCRLVESPPIPATHTRHATYC